MDVLSLVKEIANIQQQYSQAGGLRPFGVSLLIGGVEDEEAKLYQTTPSGMYMQYLARCVGNLSDTINEGLEREYKENMNETDAAKLGLKLFKEALGEEEFNTDRFDIVYLRTDETLKRLSEEEVEKLS
jgi:proteasome alpha subunit